MIAQEKIVAEVISVSPNKVKISVDELNEFKIADEQLRVGSYLRVSDNDDVALLAVIENFSIEALDGNRKQKYIIEANPVGLIKDGKFQRGGDSIALPPKSVVPAQIDDIRAIYEESVEEDEQFTFSKLLLNREINVPVNGNRFFNKHIAVVGSTGSGKSHTVAKIIQNATQVKKDGFSGLNNSHIVIFDIHSEYLSAFPTSNRLDVSELNLPYWLLNSEELTELFIDTESNDHNQRNIFKEAIVYNKKQHFNGNDKKFIHFDSPVYFDINEVVTYISNRNNEKKSGTNDIKWSDSDGCEFIFNDENAHKLFNDDLKPLGSSASGTQNGKLINFINRLENKINDQRLNFLLGDKARSATFEETIRSILGYKVDFESNVNIIDLSGVPFEVLSTSVSLISRLLFDVGYYNKKNSNALGKNQDVPLLLVYEEAHKYVPKSSLSKYRSSKIAIERIAKEGRKYGVTLMLASQRPSEISETIFSQCNSFISMRLTNPEDQNYVKRLLPDTLGDITTILPSLREGDALIMGDSISIPSLVKIDRCSLEPSSTDVKYLEVWQEKWKDLAFTQLIEGWGK
ncbi:MULTISPECIES: anti-phage-associated helicase HerA [Vibrio]|uniref:anti-phage-associated helicase HerA n=1 Tax=Vibrio TaxID=662 RepID=UPI0002EBB97E|nr:anti-phage-associated helicase HerA [Vibrio tasmaniensis]OEF72080.1 Bipolar DNA helicase [Vibrio tasmaniensis 1F-155]PMO78917.1 Bipolar DNA helicase [Vibrio tasmaniensis]